MLRNVVHSQVVQSVEHWTGIVILRSWIQEPVWTVDLALLFNFTYSMLTYEVMRGAYRIYLLSHNLLTYCNMGNV